MKKKIENQKKNFPKFFTVEGGGHVTRLPPITRARGGNSKNPVGEMKPPWWSPAKFLAKSDEGV